jgi:hypothetical protein
MREKEWLACNNPTKMLDFLRSRADSRRLLLLSSACCRLVWHLLTAPRARQAVEVAERLADGHATPEEKQRAWRGANAARTAIWRYNRRVEGAHPQTTEKERRAIQSAVATTSWLLGNEFDLHAAALASDRAAQAARVHKGSTLRGERAIQANLVRDIFGNPFRPVTFDPRWRSSDVVVLAQAIYEEKAFERMPILADALMDAGCEDDRVIAHCRDDGPHVRGCWVVDLVLRRE